MKFLIFFVDFKDFEIFLKIFKILRFFWDFWDLFRDFKIWFIKVIKIFRVICPSGEGREWKLRNFFSFLHYCVSSYTLFHSTPPSNFTLFWVPSNLRRPPLNSTTLIFCLPIDIIDIDIILSLLVFLENQLGDQTERD